MRHDLIVVGYAFRLRPIGDADAPFVLELRSNPQRNRFLHATPSSLEAQLAWLAQYYERPGDYYFVVERQHDDLPEGLISIYNIDAAGRTGEWGRWILRPGSLAAVESAWLIYRCAFEQLGLEEVFSRTVADNASVVSFHDSCGIARRTLLPGYFDLDEHRRRVDAVEHRVSRAEWRDLEPRLEKLAHLTARRLNRA